jgi:hypothetical protein
MEEFLVTIDGLSYESDGAKVSRRGVFSGDPLVLPGSVCHRGVLYEVSCLKRAGGGYGNPNQCLSICIPCSVVVIGEEWFHYCVDLSVVAFERDSKLRTTGKHRFLNCGSLRSICIPAAVQTIPSLSLYQCRSLSSLVFERNSELTSVEDSAVFYNAKLVSLCLPPRLTELGRGSFPWTQLQYVAIDPQNQRLSMLDNRFLVLDGVAVVAAIGLPTELWIPNTIERFCDTSFAFQRELHSMRFEPGCRLRRFGCNALACCRSLKSIDIPTSVEILDNGCLSRCPYLLVVSFEPDSKLSQIHYHSFYECFKLRAIRVPSHLVDLCQRSLAEHHQRLIVSLDVEMDPAGEV